MPDYQDEAGDQMIIVMINDDVDDGDDHDHDIYIMMQCLCVCNEK